MINKSLKSSNSDELFDSLAPKELVFVNEYSQGSSGTKACEVAGYSKKTAAKQANRLLSRDHIREAIHARKLEISEKADLTSIEVIQGLRKQATDYSKTGSASARVAALIALGKTMGIFEADNKQRQPVILNIVNREPVTAGQPKVINIRKGQAEPERPSFIKDEPLALGSRQ